MPVGTRGAVKGVTFDQVARARRGHRAREHVSPASSSRRRAHRPHGGAARIHRLGSADSHRLGWISGVQSRDAPDARRAGCRVSLASGRTACAITPESAVDMQARLGSDVAMMFDECPSWPATKRRPAPRWSGRCDGRRAGGSDTRISTPAATAPCRGRRPGKSSSASFKAGPTRRFAIEVSAGTLAVGFDAYAIGGLSVGEPVDSMYDIVDTRPRSCPTPAPLSHGHGHARRSRRKCRARDRSVRLRAAHAQCAERPALHAPGAVRSRMRATPRTRARPIRRARARPAGSILAAILRHLFMAGEITGAVLNTLHNLYFYLDTMRPIRDAIEFGDSKN